MGGASLAVKEGVRRCRAAQLHPDLSCDSFTGPQVRPIAVLEFHPKLTCLRVLVLQFALNQLEP
ncbi:MAG: hypothetical protein C4293_17575 [Nitrospiraceae bacterium]